MLPFGLLVLAVVAVPLHILDAQGLPRYRALRGELARVQDNNDRMRREVQALSAEVDRLRRDPRAVERIARDELGMVRKDEIVFQF
jgi:cell division protein FtsB